MASKFVRSGSGLAKKGHPLSTPWVSNDERFVTCLFYAADLTLMYVLRAFLACTCVFFMGKNNMENKNITRALCARLGGEGEKKLKTVSNWPLGAKSCRAKRFAKVVSFGKLL